MTPRSLRIITLVAHRTQGGYYSVTDSRGKLYIPPGLDFTRVERLMRKIAFDFPEQVQVDEESVAWCRAQAGVVDERPLAQVIELRPRGAA